MARKVEAPKIRKSDGPMLDGTVSTHPAFAQISAHRINGSSVLYGSDFLHHGFIIIEITKSELHRDLSRDWHFPREELIEVALSEAQWATFVSSLNVGGGVPCTLRTFNRADVPEIPFRRQEDVFRDEVHNNLRQLTEKVEATIKEMDGEIGSSLSGKKKAALLKHLDKLRRIVSDSLPFVSKQFEEHMENTVENAKVEVHGYVQNLVMRSGLETLGAQKVLSLRPGQDAQTEE